MSDATENYVVRWFHAKDGNRERGVPTQEQCDLVVSEVRGDPLVSDVVIEHVQASRRWTVSWWHQLQRRQLSREYDTKDEAVALATECRANEFVTDVKVRTSPVVRRHRSRVLDATGRPI